MKRKFLSLLLSILLSQTVLAGSELYESFKAAGLDIPQKLKQLGYSNFGKFNLDQFIGEIKYRSIIPDESLGKRNNDLQNRGRITARWEWNNDQLSIRVNPTRWFHFKEQQSILALHEHLMASGYVREQDYWASMSMWLLAHPKISKNLKRKHKEKVKKALELLLEKKNKFNGVVGVGGGGEVGTIYIRMMQLNLRIDKYRAAESLSQRDRFFGEIYYKLFSRLTVSYYQ